MKCLFKTVVVSAILLLVPILLFAQDMKREEMLLTGGALWNTPSNWNPLLPDNAVPGTIGLVYDPLFYFNPVTGKHVGNLAESGKWITPKIFEIKLRTIAKWSDGQPLTVDDVTFSFTYLKGKSGLKFSVLWNALKEVKKINDTTVQIVFEDATYQQLKTNLYNVPIIPKHIWETKAEGIAAADPNKDPIGSGPYKHEIALEDRDIFIRDDNWWGKTLYKKLPAPKRVVILKGFSNNTALGMITKGDMDVSNYFLFGMPKLMKTNNLAAFYDNAPYNFPFNTVLVFINTRKAPLNDPKLRRAMAFAVNSKLLAERVYENMVAPCDSTGLHPLLKEWVDPAAIKKYGFKFDPAEANRILDKAGYKMEGKFRNDPSGNPFALTISCPFGWTDWEEACKLIAENCRAVGINLEAKFPDYGKYQDEMTKCEFDLLLNNWGSTVSATPYTYWNWVAAKDVKSLQSWSGNWGRYDNEKLFGLIGEFDAINPDKEPAKLKKVAAEIEEILLKDMPSIPFWYNGAWFAGNQTYWKNYPDGKNKVGVPLTWQNAWQMGGVNMLLNLEPVKK
jgi:peptide/nickel transport system substrate-binding protein